MRSQIIRLISILIFSVFAATLALADGMPEETMNGGSGGRGLSSVKGHSSYSASSRVRNSKSRPSLGEKDLLAYQYCGKDSDCMQVINGCCQCVQGDSYVAINKERLQAFQARFACEQASCPKSEPISYSCEDGLVTCLSHRCQYVPPTR